MLTITYISSVVLLSSISHYLESSIISTNPWLMSSNWTIQKPVYFIPYIKWQSWHNEALIVIYQLFLTGGFNGHHLNWLSPKYAIELIFKWKSLMCDSQNEVFRSSSAGISEKAVKAGVIGLLYKFKKAYKCLRKNMLIRLGPLTHLGLVQSWRDKRCALKDRHCMCRRVCLSVCHGQKTTSKTESLDLIVQHGIVQVTVLV